MISLKLEIQMKTKSTKRGFIKMNTKQKKPQNDITTAAPACMNYKETIMKNIFYFHQSMENSKKQILLNDAGCSPLNIGYGYRLASNESGYAKAYAIVGISSELAVVERIFRDFLTTKSISRIVDKLNEEQIPTRSNRSWNYNSVSNILKNENYIGIFSFRKYDLSTLGESLMYHPKRKADSEQVFLSGLEAVSTDIWNQAQQIRLKRNKRLQKQCQPRKRIRRSKAERRSSTTSPVSSISKQSKFSEALNSLLSLMRLGLSNRMLQMFRASAN